MYVCIYLESKLDGWVRGREWRERHRLTGDQLLCCPGGSEEIESISLVPRAITVATEEKFPNVVYASTCVAYVATPTKTIA